MGSCPGKFAAMYAAARPRSRGLLPLVELRSDCAHANPLLLEIVFTLRAKRKRQGGILRVEKRGARTGKARGEVSTALVLRRPVPPSWLYVGGGNSTASDP